MGSWRIFGWIGSNMTSGNELSDICSLLNLVCNAALRGQAKKFGMLLGLKKLRLHERLRLRSSLDKSVNNSETEKRQGASFWCRAELGGRGGGGHMGAFGSLGGQGAAAGGGPTRCEGISSLTAAIKETQRDTGLTGRINSC